MEPSGRNQWQPVANGTPQKPLKQADPQPVATHGNRFGAHGKEGGRRFESVKGLCKRPANGLFCARASADCRCRTSRNCPQDLSPTSVRSPVLRLNRGFEDCGVPPWTGGPPTRRFECDGAITGDVSLRSQSSHSLPVARRRTAAQFKLRGDRRGDDPTSSNNLGTRPLPGFPVALIRL